MWGVWTGIDRKRAQSKGCDVAAGETLVMNDPRRPLPQMCLFELFELCNFCWSLPQHEEHLGAGGFSMQDEVRRVAFWTFDNACLTSVSVWTAQSNWSRSWCWARGGLGGGRCGWLKAKDCMYIYAIFPTKKYRPCRRLRCTWNGCRRCRRSMNVRWTWFSMNIMRPFGTTALFARYRARISVSAVVRSPGCYEHLHAPIPRRYGAQCDSDYGILAGVNMFHLIEFCCWCKRAKTLCISWMCPLSQSKSAFANFDDVLQLDRCWSTRYIQLCVSCVTWQ